MEDLPCEEYLGKQICRFGPISREDDYWLRVVVTPETEGDCSVRAEVNHYEAEGILVVTPAVTACEAIAPSPDLALNAHD